ncbi:hypothetical protein P3T40_002934 [Paraburkholderia sp. EB58]|jgi:hypothetical protein
MHLRWRNKPTCEGEAPGGPRTLSGQFGTLDGAAGIGDNLLTSASLGQKNPR